MLGFIPIFIGVPILIFIVLVGLFTLLIPALKHYFPIVNYLFFSILIGLGGGYALSILIPLVMASLGVLFTINAIWYHNALGYMLVMGPMVLPFIGLAIGLFLSLNKRKKIINNGNQALIA